MARKMMILCGSPRQMGNTNTVAGWVAEAAREAGAEVEVVDAARLALKAHGCTACMGCQQSQDYGCVIADDAQPVIARMLETDVLVFATPVYFFGPTAQLKCVLDRMFSLVKVGPEGMQTAARGELALVSTAGSGMDGGLGLVEKMFRTLGEFVSLPYRSLLVPNAPMNPRDLAAAADLHARAEAFGQELAAGTHASA